MPEIDLELLSKEYREIRRAVHGEATRPLDAAKTNHQANKEKLRTKIEGICAEADLRRYEGNDADAARRIWHHLWRKNRYAGIKAIIAGKEIEDIAPVFDEHAEFSKSSWDICAKGSKVEMDGDDVRHFLERTGRFVRRQTIGKRSKLCTIIGVARKLNQFLVEKSPTTPALNFVTNGHALDDVWSIHAHLLSIGYKAHLTALHFMMDLGFQVIKPDIVISRLFFERGWLRLIVPGLPETMSASDLNSKGKHGAKYHYTKRFMYEPIINLARQIVARTKQSDLIDDIGWVTPNPLREFDIFLVKFGQVADPEFGIERCLASVQGEAASVNTKCVANTGASP